LALPTDLARKAEALHLADRNPKALEAVNEAEALAERFEQRSYLAELHRLRGVFLAAIGAEEALIEASFCEAIRIAKGAEVRFARETRQKNLRRISCAKNRTVRSAQVSTNSFVISGHRTDFHEFAKGFGCLTHLPRLTPTRPEFQSVVLSFRIWRKYKEVGVLLFALWPRITDRPRLTTASSIRPAGAWSWKPCRAGPRVHRRL